MAVNAKFQADFTDFISAINQADIKLVDFGKGANKVEGTLNKMVDSFSGRRVIQEASLMTIAIEKAGGISTLTAKELEQVGNKANEAADKLKRLGYEVPAGLQSLADATKKASESTSFFGSAISTATGLLAAFGVQLTVEALVNFGKAIFDNADALTKLHDKTGLSIEGLQRFQVAGDDAGNTVEQIGQAILSLEDRLAGGDKSAVGAIERLGLSLEALKALSPEQQFIAISDAIRQIEDPAQQVNLAIDLFGKSGAEVLPVLKRGFDDLRDSTVGMSRDTVKALDDAGDAANRFWRSVKSNFGEAFADILTLSLSETRRLNSEFQSMVETVERAAPKIAGMAPPGLPADLDEINAKFAEQARIINEQNTPAAIAFRNALDALSITGMGWRKVVDEIDGAVVEAIKYYLQAGVSQNDLAAAYGLTATQVRAVAAALKEEGDAATFAATAKARSIEITKQMTAATNAQVIAQLALNQANEAFLATELAAARAADQAMFGSGGGISSEIHGNIRNPILTGGNGGFTGGGLHPLTGLHPLRAGGGAVSTGTSYVVGERGPELFTPGSNGFVTPNGAGVTNVVIHVNGTAADVARKVAQEIKRTMMYGGKMSPS